MEELSDHSKEVARGSFWSLAGNIFFKLLSFFYVIIIARAASQEDVGLFYLALGAVSVVSVFSDLGISSALVRYVPYFHGKKEEDKIRSLIDSSHLVLSAMGIIIMGALWLGADYLGSIYQSPRLPDAVRMMSAYILLINIFRLHYLFLQGMLDIKGSQIMQNIQNTLKVVLTALFFYLYGATVLMMSLAFLLSHLIALVFSSLEVRKLRSALPPAGPGSKTALIREVAPVGLMLAAIQYLSVLIASSDRLLLGYLSEPSRSASLVAVYAMGTTLAGVLSVFPASIGNIFLPIVSRLAGKNDLSELGAVMETAQRWTLFITLPIAIVLIVFSGEMLSAFYGPGYESGALATSIFTAGLVLSSLYYIISLALAAMRMVRIELEIAFWACAVNVALNILLIPLYGLEGSAMAAVAGFALALALSRYYGKKQFGFSFPPEVYKLLLAALASLAILFLIKPLLLPIEAQIAIMAGGGMASKIAYLLFLSIVVSLSMALFIISALLAKCFRNEDLALMRSAMARAYIPRSLITFAQKIASYGVSQRR